MLDSPQLLSRRIRQARRTRNAYWVVALALALVFTGVYVAEDALSKSWRSTQETVVAEVVRVDRAEDNSAFDAVMVRYQVAGHEQVALLTQGAPTKVGEKFSLQVRLDTLLPAEPDVDPPVSWRWRMLTVTSAFAPFAALGAVYELRRRSLAKRAKRATGGSTVAAA